jgi:flotillin
MSIYKVADVDKALIITGGKEPIIKVSGGAFVIPIFRKASYFDLCMLTVKADSDEIKTSTAVPVVCDWTAQIRPCVSDKEKLRTAIISFKERGSQGIIADVKLTLMGAVRDVVAAMTPEEILRDKEEFKKQIQTGVSDELDNMGLELVSLNIQDITDNNGYFNDIAAIDAADKQQASAIKKAEVDMITRQKQAAAKKAAEIAEAEAKQEAEIARMTAEQTEKEKRKETDMKLAQFKTETDTANANAEVAKELQATIRQKEVEERKGAVAITRQEQANLEAQKEREVMITRAEAEKATKSVNAAADANVKTIEADAKIQVAEREANAARKAAQGKADVATTEAEARVKVATNDAEAVKKEAEAAAAKTRAEGEAAADVAKAKAIAEAEGKKAELLADAEGTKAQLLAEAEGDKAKRLAEAEGVKASLLAQAEGERELAAARASNEKVNFEIEKLKIQTDAQIKIATAQAEIMANVGQNAEFINIGGGSIPGNGSTGNILIDTLSQFPALMKVLNTENNALNGRPVTEEVKDISKAIGAGLGALRKEASTDQPVISKEDSLETKTK